MIAKDRTGPDRVMMITNDIDADGYWTINNWSALFRIAAFHYVAEQLSEVDARRDGLMLNTTTCCEL